MANGDGPILTKQQLEDYEELGFLHSIPVLSQDEVDHYRAEVEKTCQAVGDRVTRLDNIHFYFRWAWDLSRHPRLLDALEQIIGPNIVLKSTRLFYKYGRTTSYVGWHQDGVTERLEDGRAPAVWLGLTAATVENGCLRVVPRSHRSTLLKHYSNAELKPLAGAESAQVERWSRVHGEELSGRITSVPTGFDEPFDVVMRPGEMSIHHPVTLHGSNSNVSSEARIGLSASYSAPELYNGRRAVVCVRRDASTDRHNFEVIDKPPAATFEAAVANYCASDHYRILFTTA